MSDDLISVDPEIMGGTPCIKGTRLTVYIVAARIRGGESVAILIEDYPHLTIAQVEAALVYADRIPFEEHPDGRPWRKTKSRADVA